MQIDKDVKAILEDNLMGQNTYTGPGGREYLRIDYPEGTLSEDWNSGVISFQKADDNENMIRVFAPEEEYGNQWGLSILDVDGNNLIAESTVQGIGEYEVETIALGTDDWTTAETKIKQLIEANPLAKDSFSNFSVPAKVIDLMVKWNKLKDAGQNPMKVFKILEIN